MNPNEKIIKEFHVKIYKSAIIDEDDESYRVNYHHAIEDEAENVYDMLTFCMSMTLDVITNRIHLMNMDFGVEVEQDGVTTMATERIVDAASQIMERYQDMRNAMDELKDKL